MKPLVTDALWAVVAPLLPKRRAEKGGRPWADDRATLCGLLYVLRSGIPWRCCRRNSAKLDADKGYDYRRCRNACVERGIKHRIARKGLESKHSLGRHR